MLKEGSIRNWNYRKRACQVNFNLTCRVDLPDTGSDIPTDIGKRRLSRGEPISIDNARGGHASRHLGQTYRSTWTCCWQAECVCWNVALLWNEMGSGRDRHSTVCVCTHSRWKRCRHNCACTCTTTGDWTWALGALPDSDKSLLVQQQIIDMCISPIGFANKAGQWGLSFGSKGAENETNENKWKQVKTSEYACEMEKD